MAIKFVNITKEEFLSKIFIYRFTTIERALELMSEDEITFRDPSNWPDPFEKLFINAMFTIHDKVYPSPLKGKTFCICFTGTDTSEAFWNTYSPSKDGVRIKLSRFELFNLLESISCGQIYIGKVEYKATKKITFDNWQTESNAIIKKSLSDKLIKLLFQKRKAFRYEDEYRILFTPETLVGEDYVKFKINKKGFIKGLLLHPLIGNYTEEIIKNHVYLNYQIPTIKSVLYKDKSVDYNLSSE